MTVIPGSKLGLRGNHQCVKLLGHPVVLTQHTWAFSFLLHNQIYSRKKMDTPYWLQMSALWREIQPWRWGKKMPPPNHTIWRVTCRVSVHEKNILLKDKRLLSYSNPRPSLSKSSLWPGLWVPWMEVLMRDRRAISSSRDLPISSKLPVT